MQRDSRSIQFTLLLSGKLFLKRLITRHLSFNLTTATNQEIKIRKANFMIRYFALAGLVIAGTGLSHIGTAQKPTNKDMDEESDSARRSQYRYVIVYNDLHEDERRIQIIIQQKDVNERALRYIFEAIAERFSDPIDLSITAHTSLETIETPEEREMDADGEDSRFKDFYHRHKMAGYSRFSSGRIAFSYTVSLSPKQREKVVVIREAFPR
jgi:hypothetical protein